MSAYDDSVGNSNAPKPAKKGSGCGKIVLILGGLMFLMMLVCAGGIGFVAYSFWPKISTTPAEVTTLSKEILDLDVPADFNPAMSFVMDNFIMKMRMVSYNQKEGKGDLMFGDLQVKAGDPKQQQQRPDLSGSDSKSKKLHIGETEVKELTVRGKAVPFRFSDATDDSDQKYRVVEGDFQTGTTTTFIKYSIQEDLYDEEAVTQMIEGIR